MGRDSKNSKTAVENSEDVIRKNPAEIVKEFIIMTFATLIIACAVFFFLVPSHTAVNSVSGLAIVLSNLVPFSVSQITLCINIILLVIGFLTCGNEFGIKTVYTSILLPVLIGVFEKLFPNNQSLTGDMAIDVVAYIFTVSIGVSILFSLNASSGGTDIPAMILNKYLHMELGRASTLVGVIVAFSAALVYDSKTVILSILGSYFNGVILDEFIFNRNRKRRVCITSPKDEEIRKFIIENLKSGATIYEAYGAYRMQKHKEIIVIVDKREYQQLMNFMQKTDPQAFMTIYDVNEVRYRSKSLSERIF
ncbi:Uncharacterized membrane-anchored protein YitT, contains DUF161 and DUF2179 domains [Butyrivibrio fibrisolvens DSM 3071]|jgi:uncharacterized membrane-anchored protein YitT (DUF2179 family)|uniref:Uncharacterized membrane-anchored protein YitT, contains DUF161 and DUF2179 domains n=2 Tax=Butyrivibrio fibrisolvens TaxID=831 RepID=A0A1M5ZM70_BUTFI|nr:YitT family protein [Butyrivibrio fibrisolvens]SHI25252.1 Uncharacterized membrane-anchored protein YitT, contains DUF161 and DUF2179 domains [Butyrivibrio fibrisolvens DSM 3071]